jgi:type II secretory pathway pseudopilin PulG
MTLVEILAGLIILSILALVVLRYLGVSVTAGVGSLSQVRDAETVVSVMERITVDYRRRLDGGGSPLADLQSAVGPAGSSQTNAYGTYEVLTNGYIAFDGAGHEVPDATGLNTLKIKIQVGNRRLVALFGD